MSQPAVILKPMVRTDEASWQETRSYIGGLPQYDTAQWPENSRSEAKVLHFLAQLDCRELARLVPETPLPKSGVLQFFLDTTTFIDFEQDAPASVIWQDVGLTAPTMTPPAALRPIGGYAWEYVFKHVATEAEAPKTIPRWPLQLSRINTTHEEIVHDVMKLRGPVVSKEEGPPQYVPSNMQEIPFGALNVLCGLLQREIQSFEDSGKFSADGRKKTKRLKKVVDRWNRIISRYPSYTPIGFIQFILVSRDLNTVSKVISQIRDKGYAFQKFEKRSYEDVPFYALWTLALETYFKSMMAGPREGFDRIPCEIRQYHQSEIDCGPYDKDILGGWLYWHQALGPAFAVEGNETEHPDPSEHIMLLRLTADDLRGLALDTDHTPVLIFWIKKSDLEAGNWSNAFARISDF